MLFFLCFVLVLGMVLAANDSWGDINNGTSASSSASVGDNITQPSGSVPISSVSDGSSSGDGTYFTSNFYIALGLILIFLIILGFFAWLWIRGPKNKWE